MVKRLFKFVFGPLIFKALDLQVFEFLGHDENLNRRGADQAAAWSRAVFKVLFKQA
jgi:hypothetical protein